MAEYSANDRFVGRLWDEFSWWATMWVPAAEGRIVVVVDPSRHDKVLHPPGSVAVLLPRAWLTESAARIASTLLGAEFDTNALREPNADEEAEHFSSELLRSYRHLVTSDEEREPEPEWVVS